MKVFGKEIKFDASLELPSWLKNLKAKKGADPKDSVKPKPEKKPFFDQASGKAIGELLEDEEIKKKVIASVSVFLLLVLMTYFFLLSPKAEEIEREEARYAQLKKMRQELATTTRNLELQQLKMEELRLEMKRVQSFFHSEEELDELYKMLSTSAQNNALRIESFSKRPPSPVYEKNVGKKRKKTDVLYIKRPVEMRLSGGYQAYVRFREDLANLKKAVNTESERMETINDKPGEVNVIVTFFTYELPENKEKS
jgi:Tfp pilus assembly protein PilO